MSPNRSPPRNDLRLVAPLARTDGRPSQDLDYTLGTRQVTPTVGNTAGNVLRRWYRAKGLPMTVRVQQVERPRDASTCVDRGSDDGSSCTVEA
jgi:hypothetical protein